MKSRILRSALTSLTLATAAILPTAGTSQAYVSGPMGMAWFNWSIEDSSSYSLGHISFPIQVDAMDTLESGKGQYYYSNMYKINGGNRGYIGVQPIKNASNGNMQAQTIFSLFGAGAKPESDKCRSGADGGAGVSCSGWISRFEFGKTYKFEIDQDANNRSLWHGSVRFPDGHAEPIGSYSVPSNWGGIEQRETGSFVEWVRGVESCEKLPWTEVSFGRPESRNATGTTHGARSGGKCGGKTYVGISGGGTQQLNIRMGGTAQKPSAPSGLRDSGVTANQVKLMWNPAPAEENVTGYEVFRNDQKIADVSSGVEFTDTQVSPNTDYAYKVRAVNMPGESPFSNTVNVKTPAESSPSQPVVVSQAWLVKKDNGQTLVSVKGKGTPGSQVFVKASNGSWSDRQITVGANGEFSFISGYYEKDGVTVQLRKDGQSQTSDKVALQAAPATISTPAAGSSVERTFTVTGKGEAGAEITVKAGSTEARTTVKADKTWTVNLANVATGAQELSAVQTIDKVMSTPTKHNITVADSTTPGDPSDPSDPSDPTLPTWDPRAAYTKGDRVTHNGTTYQCVQSYQGNGDPNWINALSLWAPVKG